MGPSLQLSTKSKRAMGFSSISHSIIITVDQNIIYLFISPLLHLSSQSRHPLDHPRLHHPNNERNCNNIWREGLETNQTMTFSLSDIFFRFIAIFMVRAAVS